MVKYTSYANSPLSWIEKIKNERGDKHIATLQNAINFYSPEQSVLLEKGIDIADILYNMGLDNESLAASVLYPLVQDQEVDLDTITDYFGISNRKLLQDALQMRSLGKLQDLQSRGQHQVENLRKMLLAMVTDVRAVLIILAERLWQLRQLKSQPESEQQKIAQETMDIFAPLANRLGVWHLKWEMEDLCLRYLQPEQYASIAKWLASKREEREAYIKRMIVILEDMLKHAQIKNFTVMGRVKHIYSIYKKMLRKNAKIEQIYDISALRVLVNSIDDCYSVLGLIQNTYEQVPEEFDDYISQPKPNGYQSIHTVILGPENRHNEIQIRTYEMHDQSELGVAAHWRYKEGVLQPSSYENKIALLRQIMAWQKEITHDLEEKQTQEKPVADLLSDRVYVFTPLGDIMDLPQGATPLDFAYHVHSELGHRCRGAKVNGHIVQLTYQLKTGERVEVITAKEAHPSRDWLNPNYGYLATPRARAKAAHWFRVRDSMQPQSAEQHKEAAPKEHVKSLEPLAPVAPSVKSIAPSVKGIQISGVDNVLTKMARCCKPLPGDPIVGYITQNRGISIHRKDCNNLSNLTRNNDGRMVEVAWGGRHQASYPVDLQLITYDRAGLLRDITTMLASEKINLIGLNTTQTGANIQEAVIYLTLEIDSVEQLKKAIDFLTKIPNVLEVRRR